MEITKDIKIKAMNREETKQFLIRSFKDRGGKRFRVQEENNGISISEEKDFYLGKDSMDMVNFVDKVCQLFKRDWQTLDRRTIFVYD